jgi:hypothetical protein
MAPPKSPHEESTTYAKKILQSEMFQLEHSSDLFRQELGAHSFAPKR